MNKLYPRLALALCLALLACQPAVQIYDLRCEGLEEPLGIDSAQPHFSWKIKADGPVKQAAYEIQVGPGLWRSGRWNPQSR